MDTEMINDKVSQGIMLISAEKYDAAKKVFEEIISEAPRTLEAYIHLGNACANLEQYSEATEINSSMDELPNYWEGAAYDNARSTYEEEYQTLLTTTVPEAVGNFRDYINQCMEKIIEIDEQLAGN